MSLEVSEICFSYGKKFVLHDISFSLSSGCVLGLLGANGSGKSTLLKAVGALHHPQKGQCRLDGLDLLHLSAAQRARLVAYVPQNTHSPFPTRVIDMILMGRAPFIRFSPSKADQKIAEELLHWLGLESLAFENICHLSGGERQRVLIARALAQQPKLLILDEPTSSLDLKYQLETLELVRKAADEQQLSAIVSIHDLNLAGRFSDQLLMMKDGRITANGTPTEVLTAKNIQAVYGVKTIVRQEENGVFILPLEVSS